jgi:cell division protein FtsW
MNDIVAKIRGDKGIWAIVFLLALISFLPVYSASTNLVYVIGKGSTLGYLIKHLGHLFLGFVIIYFVHKVPYHYFRALSIFGIPIVIVLLIYTLTQGTTMGGANASRWIQIPFVGIGFQTSTFAFMVLMVYVARYLAKIEDKVVTFKESFLELWLPVFGVLILILPANFSTTALIFTMVCMVVYIGYYPIKYLLFIVGLGILALTFFVLIAKAFPDAMPNRVKTWEKRIERFTSDKADEDVYQLPLEELKG